MAYESVIGWRFLYRGKAPRGVVTGLLVSLVIVAIGLVALFSADPPSAWGVLALTLGTLGAIACVTLSLFTVFTTVSIVGVVLGVAALIVVLSVTSGFQEQFRDKILGVNAHVLIMKNSADFSNYREVEELAAKKPHVVAVQPFNFEEMLVTRGTGELSAVAIKGVDPDRLGGVLSLPEHIVSGDLDSLREPGQDDLAHVIIGQGLADKLRAKVGDRVKVVSPLSGLNLQNFTHSGKPPRSREFLVGGIFYSGFDEYDRRLMYVSLAVSQDFADQGDVVRGVEMTLDDVDEAALVAHQLQEELGRDAFHVLDWRKLNDNLFRALSIQKVVLLIFLTLIIVVAAFNMVSSLTMLVLDKTKEIAILKSMGSTDWGVARVFQVVGLAIGSVGTLLGLVLGLSLCVVVERYGYPLDPRVYLIDRLPVEINPLEVILVAIVSLVICAVVTLYPALSASRLRPVHGLRYD